MEDVFNEFTPSQREDWNVLFLGTGFVEYCLVWNLRAKISLSPAPSQHIHNCILQLYIVIIYIYIIIIIIVIYPGAKITFLG